MEDRRSFLKKTLLAGGITTFGGYNAASAMRSLDKERLNNLGAIRVNNPVNGYFEPLETVVCTCEVKGMLVAYDGAFNEYYRQKADTVMKFEAAGVLGYHVLVLEDGRGRPIDTGIFLVNAKTGLDDEGEFADFFEILKFTMMDSSYNRGQLKRMNGKHYLQFSSWFQDHMYAMLGMQYFEEDLKSGVDLYTEGQREDGMIHDNYKHQWDPQSPWKRRFDYGNFVKLPEDAYSSSLFVRVPVENMAEYTYLEAVYRTWKASGDDKWMMSKLNSMLRAMEYTLNDKYRWSEKFKLTKRGYTIDIWDFQSDFDARITGDLMKVDPEKSYFGISYADNVRFAQSCGFLSEMLDYSGLKSDAARVKRVSEEIKARIDDLSWNGEFYRHWVPEDPGIDRHFGAVDETRQVTMSHTWILNRGIMKPDQIRSIIETYLRIQKEMPETSPGEWYCCFPPYDKGWSAKKWNYMNGGVTPIAAGELARACFENGYEAYGADILRRTYALALKSDRILHGCYKGAIEPEPDRTFHSIDLRKLANVDFTGDGVRPEGVMGWTGEGDNDLHEFPVGRQDFIDIPFDVIDPAENGRRAVLGISSDPGYHQSVEIGVQQKAGSLYFLHCLGGGAIAGNITWKYADGTSETKYISALSAGGLSQSITNWWLPDVSESKSAMQYLHTAWIGRNNHTPKVGVVVYGMNNPKPNSEIQSIVLEGQRDHAKWMIIGLTLSDAPVYFKPGILSTIPQHWAAAECMYGLMEGLAGIINEGRAFKKARLAPRWESAGVKKVKVTAKYESSGGYLSYSYKKEGQGYKVEFTGSAELTEVQLYMPDGKREARLQLNGEDNLFDVIRVNESFYARIFVEGVKKHTLICTFS